MWKVCSALLCCSQVDVVPPSTPCGCGPAVLVPDTLHSVCLLRVRGPMGPGSFESPVAVCESRGVLNLGSSFHSQKEKGCHPVGAVEQIACLHAQCLRPVHGVLLEPSVQHVDSLCMHKQYVMPLRCRERGIQHVNSWCLA